MPTAGVGGVRGDAGWRDFPRKPLGPELSQARCRAAVASTGRPQSPARSRGALGKTALSPVPCDSRAKWREPQKKRYDQVASPCSKAATPGLLRTWDWGNISDSLEDVLHGGAGDPACAPGCARAARISNLFQRGLSWAVSRQRKEVNRFGHSAFSIWGRS